MGVGFSQEENEECGQLSDSKIEKLIEKGKNSKKYEYKERIAFFKDAIEYDDECIQCMWEIAKLTYRKSYSSGENFDIAKKYFHQIESLCPAFHADVYYYLSLIYYSEKNDCDALKYFKKFLDLDVSELIQKNKVGIISGTLCMRAMKCMHNFKYLVRFNIFDHFFERWYVETGA